jgi:hypothetical protein
VSTTTCACLLALTLARAAAASPARSEPIQPAPAAGATEPQPAPLEEEDPASIDPAPSPLFLNPPSPPLPLPAPAGLPPLDPYPDRRHYLRASLETLGGLALSEAWYWRNLNFNSVDWDLKWDAPSWRRKVITFDAIRFDTNAFDTNAVSHPRTYTIAYVAARSNGLSVTESFLMTLAASVLWEFLGEFREYPSINDLIMSPSSAVATGEPFVQLGAFFARGSDNTFNRIASAAASPARAVHDFLDGVSPRRAAWVDRWGFPRDVWHRFELGFRAGGFASAGEKSRWKLEATTDLQLRSIFQYGQPVTFARWLGPGALTRLNASVVGNTAGLALARVFGDLSLVGRHWQSFQRRDSGDLDGGSFYAGLATAFDYGTRLRPDRREDRMGIADLLGVMVELVRRRAGFWARLEGQAYGSFALVDAFALERYAQSHPLVGIKSVLEQRGYYYAFGTTVWPRLQLGYRSWDLGAGMKGDFFTSIDARDRAQETLTNDVHLTDSRTMVRAWLGHQGNTVPLRLTAAFERERRSGTMGGVSDQVVDLRGMFGAALVF